MIERAAWGDGQHFIAFADARIFDAREPAHALDPPFARDDDVRILADDVGFGVEFGDLAKFVNFDYVANVARLNAATLASLASAPAPAAKVRLLATKLENDSTLTWEPSAGASGYEVLWRATTSPEWEHARAVGNVTRTTVSISKDNVIFAVRAVDNQGHRGLAATPLPER